MILAFFLASIPWIWFSYGPNTALVIVAVAVIANVLTTKKILLSLSCFALAVTVLGQLESQMRHVLPRAFQHQIETLTVCIDQPMKTYDDYASGNALVRDQPEYLSLRRLKLTLPSKFNLEEVLPGQCLTGKFRLRQPFGTLVPGAFNADRYYFSVNIDAKATLIQFDSMSVKSKLSHEIYRKRRSLFKTDEGLQVWSALTLGWSGAISSDLRSLLTANQVMHLFVISGMHIGFLAFAAYLCMNAISTLISPYWVFDYRAKGLVVFTLIAGYVSLLGWPTPATRALIMAAIPFGLYLSRANLNWSFGLLASGILILLVQPESFLSIGTWLSFLSVTLILIIIRWQIIRPRHLFFRLLVFQSLMSLSMIPWAFLFGFQVNSFAGLTNLLITPIIAFVLLPVSFLIAVTGSPFTVFFFETALKYLVVGLGYIAQFGTQFVWLPFSIVFMVCLLVFQLVWLPDRGLKLCLILSCLLLGMTTLLVKGGERDSPVRITIFDVGHGLSVLIEDGTENWLYDTAGQRGSESTQFEQVLDRSIPPLTGVIVSHSDIDHSAGTGAILSSRSPLYKWSGQPELMPRNNRENPFINCHDAHLIHPNLMFFAVPKSLSTSDNDHSCVLVFKTDYGSMILTGDAGTDIEYYIMQTYPDHLPFDIVLLGHHGSASSSSSDWLDANQESLFVLSTSDRVSPKWPSERINKWFADRPNQLLSTAIKGTIQINFKEGGISIKTWDTVYRNRLIN